MDKVNELTERRFKNAVKAYNSIMCDLCLEYLTTDSTDGGIDRQKWNIRDFVSECQYQLDLYYSDTNQGYELNEVYNWNIEDEEYTEYKEMHDKALKEVRALRAFINKYKVYAKQVKCVEAHSSKWD